MAEMTKWEAQQYYWSSFGLLAFNEQTVPDFVPVEEGQQIVMKPLETPYITYEPVVGSLNGPMTATARVWYHGTSYKDVFKKCDEIAEKGDKEIPIKGGKMLVRIPERNFARPLDDPNDKQLRTAVLTVNIEFLSM